MEKILAYQQRNRSHAVVNDEAGSLKTEARNGERCAVKKLASGRRNTKFSKR